MVAILLALHAVSGLSPSVQDVLPSAVSESITQALAVADARVVPLSWRAPSACRIQSASVPQPIVSSGRIAVKVSGRNCSGWAWVQIEVWAKTAVTTQALRAGDPIVPAITLVEREILSGRAPFVPSLGAVAGRSLPAGTVLCANDASGSAAVAGESVRVLIASGLVAIETQGRRISCPRSRACAVLSTGKHVEGRWDERGRLIVEIAQ